MNFDFDKCVEDHGTTSVQVDLVFLHCGFLGWGIWIPSVDGEGLNLGRFGLERIF